MPTQIEKFFELQRFDLDITTTMADSPKHTVMGSSMGGSMGDMEADDMSRISSFGSNYSATENNPFMPNGKDDPKKS